MCSIAFEMGLGDHVGDNTGTLAPMGTYGDLHRGC